MIYLLCGASIMLNLFFITCVLDIRVKRVHRNRKQTLKFAKNFKIK